MTFTQDSEKFWRSEIGKWISAAVIVALWIGFDELLIFFGFGSAARIIVEFPFLFVVFYYLYGYWSDEYNEHGDE